MTAGEPDFERIEAYVPAAEGAPAVTVQIPQQSFAHSGPAPDEGGPRFPSPLEASVLVVDDDPLVAEVIGGMLRADDADVTAVGSAETALTLLSQAAFDLVILDVSLPGLSGFEALRRLREVSDVPVMMLTGAGSLAERLAGFDLGADDYVLKPVEVQELRRRVRALLRRGRGMAPRSPEELSGPGGLTLRLSSHEATVNHARVDLTPKEFSLLRLLLDRRGDVVSPDEISRTIWGYETFGSRNFVEAHISRLRSKLAKHGAPDVITTIRGVGYIVR